MYFSQLLSHHWFFSADVLALGLPQLDPVDWGANGLVLSTGTFCDHRSNGCLTGARCAGLLNNCALGAQVLGFSLGHILTILNIKFFWLLIQLKGSSCGGLRLRLLTLFVLILSHFWYSVVTLLTFTSNLRNFEKNPKNPKK